MLEFQAQRLGVLLRKLREDRDESQQQVADATGIDQKTVSQIERGNIADPGFVRICRIAEHFDITPNDMAAMSGILLTEGTEDDVFPADVARGIQRLYTYVHALGDPTRQRAFLDMLDETMRRMDLAVEREEIYSTVQLPSYIRKKLLRQLPCS